MDDFQDNNNIYYLCGVVCVGGQNLVRAEWDSLSAGTQDSWPSPLENFKDGARSHLKAEPSRLEVGAGCCENLAGAIRLSKAWAFHNMLAGLIQTSIPRRCR